MRITVDHSKEWLTRHEKGRGLFLASFSVNTKKGSYHLMEIAYWIWNVECLGYRCEN